MNTTITIKGTHCPSCKALIEEVSMEQPGITACTVDYVTGKTVIEHDVPLDRTQLQRAISEVGEYTLEQKKT